ncbi:MAG: aspartate kinase [Flavobacteriales bacterium]
MKVFKFGGASVKDAASVRNVASILQRFPNDKLVVVISAMGKVTNALEELHRARYHGGDTAEIIQRLTDYHRSIAEELFGNDIENCMATFDVYMNELLEKIGLPKSTNEDLEYDKIVCYGELFSTSIVFEYLKKSGFNTAFTDARLTIKTDDRHRDARVDWNKSALAVQNIAHQLEHHDVVIIQGFIGSDSHGNTTTLGREGSDFTAAIMAYLLDATDVTIWKDVPGMLNADPKVFENTTKLDKISFREAIELAYYGASVIHPKTVKPLQNKNIPLYIKSFIDPEAAGSAIQENQEQDSLIPCFISKKNQVLISITPRDFSFVVEDNLKEIFELLSTIGVRIHLMENSALSFSICVDKDEYKQEALFRALKEKYTIRYNEGLTLLTARHYNDENIKMLTANREILLEQRNRQTIRFVAR